MGLECGECEHDLRGGHHPSCSRYRPPARCAICDKQLVDGDGEEYCPAHGSVDAVNNLVKAGALILAEIERLDRIKRKALVAE